ncbi:MAG: hypothetical protein JXR97_08915 [Planctomycetes bacterium]|nr:hypothetical protein [Planctomycetota bacterium]
MKTFFYILCVGVLVAFSVVASSWHRQKHIKAVELSFDKKFLAENPSAKITELEYKESGTDVKVIRIRGTIDSLDAIDEKRRYGFIDIDHCKIKDGIKFKPIYVEQLNLFRVNIKDLGLIQDLRGVTHLQMDCVDVKDYSSLRMLRPKVLLMEEVKNFDNNALGFIDTDNLTSLHISGTDVTDIGHLAGSKKLKILGISKTGVSDISALASTPIKHLYMANCKVTDLSPLKNSTLEELRLDNTEVSDLTPLVGVKLTALYLIGCKNIKNIPDKLEYAYITMPDGSEGRGTLQRDPTPNQTD